ncbi:hypothetical protein EHO59_10935 [Leptospira semungkisensis]|uniref:Uncharacterized protein n=1 Tax=Leptospira semungkisensis TaxID=2484985 RepID=A0A4R9FYV1_9LEPT|nr:hypothetical protein [Leptospira semungkisensis]TGK04023.1 hypothetical protein EHO59_10935 [Leptospira semungkisensis]
MKILNGDQSKLDWLTQLWVILFGRKISYSDFEFLHGPIGTSDFVGHNFINNLAQSENLLIDKSRKRRGLLKSFKDLFPNKTDLQLIPTQIVDFYENTESYTLNLKVKWNPIFKLLGWVINYLFSFRLNQFNIPNSDKSSQSLSNEIIELLEPNRKRTKYTIWLRINKFNKQVLYLGIYEICTLNSGAKCVKATFPLPNGSATVLLQPSIKTNGNFILNASGDRFGDPGFYFLLRGEEGSIWAKYIKSFRDSLILSVSDDGNLFAEQAISLWHMKVMTLIYTIKKIS